MSKMERLRPLTPNIEGYLLGLIERPEVLAGKLYGLKTYKQAVREIAYYLMSSFVMFIDYEYEYKLLAYAWWLWLQENSDASEDEKSCRAFVKRLRLDVANRMVYELENKDW